MVVGIVKGANGNMIAQLSSSFLLNVATEVAAISPSGIRFYMDASWATKQGMSRWNVNRRRVTLNGCPCNPDRESGWNNRLTEDPVGP